MIRKTLMFMLALALPFLSAGPAIAANPGGAQLAQAFDAAFTRVIASGMYREMILTFDEPIAGVIEAEDYITNMSDCLPNTALTPFPKATKNPLKRILRNEEIRRGTLLSAPVVVAGGTTSDWFTRGAIGSGHPDMSAFLLDAILDEMAAHYGTGEITITSVVIPFPFNTTSALQDGIFGFSFGGAPPNYPFGLVSLPRVTVDFLDQFNAKGGRSENLRRLGSREETCTLSASGQFIHIETGSPEDGTINSLDDLQADTSVRICTGNLSTQLASAYFPNHNVFASRGEDIVDCYQRLFDDDSDIMISSLPVMPTPADLGVTGPAGAMFSIDTHIVAGTPYWTKHKGIRCFPVASPPGPFPFGTFRNCQKVGN